MSEVNIRAVTEHLRPIFGRFVDLGSSILRWRKIYTEDIDISGEGVAPYPTEDDHIATKEYVDDVIGTNITSVEEADGAPALLNVETLRFDQSDGFVVSEPVAGIARVDLASIPDSVLAENYVLQSEYISVVDAPYSADRTGVSNSAAGIQAALDTGKPVYFPAGTYRVNSTLTFNDGQHLFGAGPRLTTIKAYHNNDILQQEDVTGTNRYQGVIIRDMMLTKDAGNSGTGKGLRLGRNSRSVYRHLHISECLWGVWFNNDYDGLGADLTGSYFNSFEHLEIFLNTNCFFIGSDRPDDPNANVFIGGHFRGNGGVCIQAEDSSTCKLFGVGFEGSVTDWVTLASTTAGWEFHGCRFEVANGNELAAERGVVDNGASNMFIGGTMSKGHLKWNSTTVIDGLKMGSRRIYRFPGGSDQIQFNNHSSTNPFGGLGKRQNYLTRSELITSGVSYSTSDGTITLTGGQVDPIGGTAGVKMEFSTGAGTSPDRAQIVTGVAAATAGAKNFSLWVKGDQKGLITLRAGGDAAPNENTFWRVVVDTDWTRVDFPHTFSGTVGGDMRFSIRSQVDEKDLAVIYVWGLQVNDGGFPYVYTPTVSTNVATAVDINQVREATSLVGDLVIENTARLITPRVGLSQITADQNNYDLGDGSYYTVTSDAARTITGFVAGSDGERKLLMNKGGFTITVSNESASSTGANRVLNASGADASWPALGFLNLVYDGASARWRSDR